METPPYQYQPLQHSDSIRILILHPSPSESDPIECTICHENLSDGSLCYKAVSYTWGDSGLTHVIHCNDAKQRLPIGRNCHAALRRLRLPKKRRKLWIDAVCINQEDLSERGHQVRMMKEVYDRASDVMVMLNDDIPECSLLLDELAEANSMLDELAKAGIELAMGAGGKPPRNRPGAAIVRELETLFEDPWFKRAWVLQEVHEKGSVTIVYGSAIIPFDALRAVQFGYSGTSVTRTTRPLPLRLVSELLEEYTTSQFSLWNRLYWSRQCLATDPRDRVFALKSLLGSRQAEVDHLIDYAQSVEECFKRVAEFLLPVLALRILTATRHPHGLEMASWIPDWSQTLPLHFGAFEFETFGSNHEEDVSSPNEIENQKRALLSYSYKESHICPTLYVEGCQYSQIVERSKVLHFVDLDDVERQMLQIYNHFNNLRLHLDEKSKIDSIKTPGHFSGKIFDAMSLLDGIHLDENLHRYDATYSPIESQSPSGNDSFMTRHQNRKWVFKLQTSLSSSYEALQECSIALMQNGGLAIVPGAAQDGDVVCIIAGAIVSCLLRKYRDGSWMLVSGDCHIFGDGESTIAESDAYVDSHRSQAEKFILR